MSEGLYKEWLKPENLILLQGWKRDGLTDEQIAHNIGINVRTLSRWKVQHSQIRQALKIGKQTACYIIENELFKKAKAGNMTAIIFYLKNNWSSKYNDSPLTPEERELVEIKKERVKAQTDVLKEKVQAIKDGKGQFAQIVFNDDLVETRTEKDDKSKNSKKR